MVPPAFLLDDVPENHLSPEGGEDNVLECSVSEKQESSQHQSHRVFEVSVPAEPQNRSSLSW